MVYEKVHENYKTISKATVYRILNQFVEDNKIQKIKVLGAADRYDFNLSKHYHILCTKCKMVYDLDLPILDQVSTISTTIGDFSITSCELCFQGICPKCNKEKDGKNNEI